ncbi:unnamed protein product [Rhizoctonia solani]|uniref:Uncharacterized protein n=1 Tax=Rhizoctonia solani TaxID=456999 RepID=A0A8H2W803_9AGAM|nr:unnamed protein product [Rhizoctonia solani]
MAHTTGSSAHKRTPLDAASARHSPYAVVQRNNPRKPKSDTNSQSSSSSWLSRVSSGSSRSSLSRASLRPTASMVEEFEVEGLLGTIHRSDSIQSAQTFHSALSGDSQLFQSCHSSFISSLQGDSASCSKGAPLSRTSTAATILEFPEGPADPSYGTFDITLQPLPEFSDSESTDSRTTGEDSWIDTAQEMDVSFMRPPTLNMTFRSPLPDEPDSDDDAGMDTTIIPLPLTYHDSIETTSSSSSAPSASDLSLSSDEGPRRRIWEVSPDDYVPRPKGIPARSVASVLEIGMQWEREQQGGGARTRGPGSPPGPAVGRIRRIHGDAQYMN